MGISFWDRGKGDINMGLKEEITDKRKEIVVDSYPMSIGEMMNLYRDGELDVHPEFQRFYRWDEEQKSKLIESILLGIPVPPIFVSQKTNGKWDVIDGQQRLSTILQFLQVLKKENGEKYDPLVLQPTKFLPSLSGVRWDNNDLFSEDQKITFKREKLNFTIIKETGESDTSKYEMFQRLNTGGTHLSPQELRNCLLIMINKEFYETINVLYQDTYYKTCTPMTESQTDERHDMEWIVRYIVYISLSKDQIHSIDKGRNMDIFLTERIEAIAQERNKEIISEYVDKFKRVFKLLCDTYGENIFKRYRDGKFRGPVIVSAFESIIPGVYDNIDYWENNVDLLKDKIIQIYIQPQYENATRRGVRALDRMSQLINFSRMWFSHEN